MSVGHFLAFYAVALVVIVTPGQDTALTIRNTLGGGTRAGVGTALGVATGQLTWTLVASVGLTAVLAASQPAFEALRLAGATYLALLGVGALFAAVRGRAATAAGPAVGVRRAYRRGLISNLGNPKIAVFFSSLLPQFASSSVAIVVLGLVFCTTTALWLSAYSVVVARAGDLLRRRRRMVDAASGAALVAVGLRLATD
jgi:threonine/homoserine/homoserine lactone efflux protein